MGRQAMWRSLRLLPSISSSQSPSLPVSHLRNILSPPSKSNLGAAVPALSRSFSVSKTPAPLRSFSRSSPLSLRTFKFCTNCALVVARCVSSASPANAVKWNEPVSFSEAGEDDAKPAVPVRAYFFSTSVDLKSLVEQYKPNYITPTSRTTNYIVLKFGNHSASDGMGAWLSGSDCCYMVVFHYGSIVLFNVRDHDVDSYLKIVEKHASGLLPEMKKDEYEVRENPTLNKWMEGGLDYIMLRYLNVDAIRTIGGVLGQSIALDYYVHQVDGMVSEFADINRGMEKTGTFTMHKKKLFQIVGKANSNLADVILKLGLFEKSDIGWKDAKYAQIWEYLRDEFELSQRFGTLEIKFKFVERNIRFLHEILQNRKSALLEGVVILLISVNILIYIYNILHRSAITSL